jgi:hypothetical protein
VLLALVFGFVVTHGAYFGQTLVKLAKAEREDRSAEAARSFAERRCSLQKLSLLSSQLNLLVSVVVMILAINVLSRMIPMSLIVIAELIGTTTTAGR